MTPISDPFDDLAAMFLSDSGAAPDDPDAAKAELEMVLVGHLPVRAGLWLTPYADARARQLGTTALMRMDRDDPSLQLLRDGKRGVSDELRPGAPMLDAVQACAKRASHWIVYTGDDARLRQLLQAKPHRLTILSSADDVAIVRAYQLIKDLALTAEQESLDMPRLGLAVLGADPARAQQVLDRVRPTTSAFLGLEIELVAILPQMDHEIRSSSYLTFANTDRPAVEDVGMVIRDAINGVRPTSQPGAEAPTVDESAIEDDAAYVDDLNDDIFNEDDLDVVPPAQITITEAELAELHEPFDEDGPCMNEDLADAIDQLEQEFASSEHVAAQQDVEDDVAAEDDHEAPVPLIETIAGPNTVEPARVIKMAPAVGTHVEPKQTPSEPSDQQGLPMTLASHVEGLTTLPVRCPSYEKIELAVASTGDVHLMGRASDLRSFHMVQQWVWSHRELLAMACRDMHVKPRETSTWHVFTETPAAVADLHGAEIRLHVLAPVQVGSETAWFAAPLN